MQIQYKGFTITFEADSGIIRMFKDNVPPELFGLDVMTAQRTLRRFKRSKPGTMWGCDGIGYMVQQQRGQVEVMSSGHIPKWAKLGMEELIKEGQTI